MPAFAKMLESKSQGGRAEVITHPGRAVLTNQRLKRNMLCVFVSLLVVKLFLLVQIQFV